MITGFAGVVGAAIGLSGLAQAQDYTLRLAHYLPPTHNQAANVIPDWVQRIEDQSDGRIAIEVFPAGQLLGIADIYDGVDAGVADIGWGLPAIQPGRFPMLSLMELPFQFDSAEQASRIAMTLLEEGVLDDEFDGVVPLYIHTHSPAGVHTRTEQVTEPGDLEGLRIRFPSAPVREMLAAWGADPVGVPAPQVYENLETGVLDGVAFPYEAMKGLRLGEQVSHHTELPLYTLTFYMIMNQQVFDDMPADLQQVILENSGMVEAVAVGRSWDEEDARGRAYVEELGNEIVVIPEAEIPAWQEPVNTAITDYLDGLEADGHSAREVYDRIQELAAD
jgi:TRAP-type C4-dicarboxylate transport system substrate-binding protein